MNSITDQQLKEEARRESALKFHAITRENTSHQTSNIYTRDTQKTGGGGQFSSTSKSSSVETNKFVPYKKRNTENKTKIITNKNRMK